ncbi:Ldh family oxidoreductase [Tundrisphaera lichenicola]|uniref:Ldh family oxidoreductase n=1 Tax=Tundrisphaera lichenicola TaxID=2029860 RepID=UPI003EB745E6
MTRYRSDDLRRFASSLLTGLGVAAPRAASMATHLLWFDAAGASHHGIATLPIWLDRLARHEINPKAEERAGRERAGTAVLDGQGGLGPLVLARASGIASEKARDVGVGIVRVVGVLDPGPAAPAVADLAIGPFLAGIGGPGPSYAIGIPMPGGLPAIYDSALGSAEGTGSRPVLGPGSGLDLLSAWIGAASGGEGWTVVALSIPAMEPLSGFHARIADSSRPINVSGYLAPDAWESARAEIRERGIPLDQAASVALQPWADRLQVPWPSPLAV